MKERIVLSLFSLSPGMTMTADMTVAVRMHATSSPSPSHLSPWAWVKSLSPRPLLPPPFPMQMCHPATQATACFPCRNAWAYAWTMMHIGCIFTTPTPWGAFLRGRSTVPERCFQPLVSWAVERSSWRSSLLLKNWPSENEWREDVESLRL